MESSSSSYMSLVSLPLEAHNFKLLSSDFSQNVGNFGENARVGCDAMRVQGLGSRRRVRGRAGNLKRF